MCQLVHLCVLRVMRQEIICSCTASWPSFFGLDSLLWGMQESVRGPALGCCRLTMLCMADIRGGKLYGCLLVCIYIWGDE